MIRRTKYVRKAFVSTNNGRLMKPTADWERNFIKNHCEHERGLQRDADLHFDRQQCKG